MTCTNAAVNRINDERLSTINETEYVIEANTYTQSQSQLKPRTDPSGAVSGTPLQKELKLKLGAKIMMTYNIDTCDCLTNGAFGEVVGFKFDHLGGIKQVYVHFYDEDCGKNRRKNFWLFSPNSLARMSPQLTKWSFNILCQRKINLQVMLPLYSFHLN